MFYWCFSVIVGGLPRSTRAGPRGNGRRRWGLCKGLLRKFSDWAVNSNLILFVIFKIISARLLTGNMTLSIKESWVKFGECYRIYWWHICGDRQLAGDTPWSGHPSRPACQVCRVVAVILQGKVFLRLSWIILQAIASFVFKKINKQINTLVTILYCNI